LSQGWNWVQDKWGAVSKWLSERYSTISAWGHGILDFVGIAGDFIPGIGNLVAFGADAINTLWYAAEGDWTNAGLSAVAMIPYLGWGAKGGKYASKGLKYADDIAELATKYGDEAMELFTKYGDEIAPLIKNGPEVVEAIIKNPEAAELFIKHGDDVIAKYGDDGIQMLSQGILAKRVASDGHTLKVLANGKIVRCSTCGELAEKFAEELADPKNKQLAEWFRSVQSRAAKNPEAVADEVKIIEQQLQSVKQTKQKAPTKVVSPTAKPKKSSGKLPQDIGKMMKSQKIAPDILNKGVHFNVGKVELKLVPSGSSFKLEPVFSSYKEVDVANAVRKATEALDNSQFQKWLLKHAKAGLGMAQQAEKTKRAKYFNEVIKILEETQ
ncbi:MAG: hypothetical protein WBG70_16095, partial [Spirulinaceae cyanobacterium]